MKRLCARYEIPTAPFRIFDDAAAAADYVRRAGRPLVIKADGLAAGKGVVVAQSNEEACAALEAMMVSRRFGDAGARVVVEELLEGDEVSVFAICDGAHVVPLVPAQDHKRLLEGDRGPNTGGMGAVAPVPGVGEAAVDRIVDEILAPTLWAMAQEGSPYRGVLFAGIMMTSDGPRVLEFNVRFGDPEAQVLLPLLESGPLELVEAAVCGRVDRVAPRWRRGYAVCAVLCAPGLSGPAPHRRGDSRARSDRGGRRRARVSRGHDGAGRADADRGRARPERGRDRGDALGRPRARVPRGGRHHL